MVRTGLAALVALVVSASPAVASFPGINGPILFQKSSSVWAVTPGAKSHVAIQSNNVRDPAVSPDGKRVAYQYADHLRISDLDGSNTHNVTLAGHNDRYPAWSPDGLRLVFVRSDVQDLFSVNINGKNLTRLTRNGKAFAESEPDFSPDGSAITFDRRPCDEQGGQVCIWKIAPNGARGVNLTPEDVPPGCPDLKPGVGPRGNSSHASWSPDGDKIAFEGSPFHCQDGAPIAGNDIWVMNADGTNKLDLTPDANDASYDEQPAWSPDGSQIAFESDRLNGGADNTRDIVTMPATGLAGAKPRRVLDGFSRADLQPSWAAILALPRVKLNGGSGNDVLNGTPKRDQMHGFGGNDKIDGLAGNDSLFGGEGNDHITGSDGNDQIYAGPGNDTIAGTRGNDKLVGGKGNDKIIGGAGKNTYFGGDGDDVINSVNNTREVVNCGKGTDRVTADPNDKLIDCERISYPK